MHRAAGIPQLQWTIPGKNGMTLVTFRNHHTLRALADQGVRVSQSTSTSLLLMCHTLVFTQPN